MEKMMLKVVFVTLLALFMVSGCGEKKEEKSTAPGMKCGAGKCGANMFDGNSALAKKKKNILGQMREDDPRKECVIKATTTKAAYNCVREPDGNKLTMKCGLGKCGTSISKPKPVKKEPVMKCGASKCGSSM
jgi:uncharacterized low-complexity protein